MKTVLVNLSHKPQEFYDQTKEVAAECFETKDVTCDDTHMIIETPDSVVHHIDYNQADLPSLKGYAISTYGLSAHQMLAAYGTCGKHFECFIVDGVMLKGSEQDKKDYYEAMEKED